MLGKFSQSFGCRILLQCRQFTSGKLVRHFAVNQSSGNKHTCGRQLFCKTSNALFATKPISVFYSRSSSPSFDIALYEEVKDLPNHPEKLLIDVREHTELEETGKIPTSINVPLGVLNYELKSDYDAMKFRMKYGREKPKVTTEIIFHCMSGKRAAKAADIAIALGYQNVKNYEGSWIDWIERCSDCIITIAKYDEIKNLPTQTEKMLIDVREHKELEQTGKIPASINIPLNCVKYDLSQDYDANKFKAKYGRDKPNINTELIFSCKLGIRSGKAADTAITLGYKNVKNYQGSWLDWAKREGLPY